MKFATNAKRTTPRTARARACRRWPRGRAARPTSRSRSTRPGRSNTSRRHSRYVSSTIGKVGMARRDREQIGGALALRPERRAPARDRAAAGAARAPAHSRKRAAKSDDPVERARHDRLDLVGRGQEELRGRRLFAGGDAEDHAVVGVVDVDVDVLLAEARRDRDGPRRDDARAERAEDARRASRRSRRRSARRRSRGRSGPRRSPRPGRARTRRGRRGGRGVERVGVAQRVGAGWRPTRCRVPARRCARRTRARGPAGRRARRASCRARRPRASRGRGRA